MEKRAPITGAVGLMDYTVKLTARPRTMTEDFVVTVVVPVTTLCPARRRSAVTERITNGARSRSRSVSMHPIWIEDLIQLVESAASSELYSLLKRPDEKAVTERAYEHPVFVEDLVRNIAVKANEDSRIDLVQGRSGELRIDPQPQRVCDD